MKYTYPILLSFDIEDWQQSTWDRTLPINKVSYDNTSRLLDMLIAHDVKATMFILGKFAKKFPRIIKRMEEEGHEIACHGYEHIEVFKQSKNQFKNDVYKSKSLLEDLIGKKVTGYRAPDFSIVRESLWALEILFNLGFNYDSSIFPIKHNRYGIKHWPTEIKKVNINKHESIIEIPLSTISFNSINLPVSGGGYFRLLPKHLFSFFAKKILKQRPFIFYGHPYELNPDELKDTKLEIPYLYKVHQNLGRRFVANRLENLLKNFKISTISQYINNEIINFPKYDLEDYN